MTPEEHEQYIARLEQNAENAMLAYRQRTARRVYPLLLLLGAAAALWALYSAVEVWLR